MAEDIKCDDCYTVGIDINNDAYLLLAAAMDSLKVDRVKLERQAVEGMDTNRHFYICTHGDELFIHLKGAPVPK